MSKLAELRAEREALTKRASAINSKYGHNERMPADDANLLDRLLAKIESIDGQIDAEDAANQAAGSAWAGARGDGGADPSILRNVAEIRQYYGQKNQAAGNASGEKIGLDDFLKGVAGMKTTNAVINALSVGTDSSGGFAVPSIIMPGILEALVPASSLLSAGAGIIPLTEGAKDYTQVAVNTIPTAAWRLENGDIAESEPTFRGVTADPKSLSFYFKVSRELLADARNMSGVLTSVIAQAFAVELDRVGLRGTGVDPQPLGLRNIAGIKSVTSGANGGALAGYGKFFEAAQLLLQSNARMPTAAIMSPRSLIKLGGLADTTGQPLSRPEMLRDIRFVSTPAIPDDMTVGTSSDCSEIFMGDFTRFAFMIRESMSIQLLKEAFALKGQVGFVAHVRADVMTAYPQQFAVVSGVRP